MSDVVVFSRFNRPQTIFAPLGDGFTPVFELQSVDGEETLVEVGKDDTFSFIQASLSDTLVYNILERYKAGEVDVIERRHGFNADVTGMPKTLAEAQRQLTNISNNFDQLPDSVKNKVGGDVNEFIRQVATGSVESVKSLLFGEILEKVQKQSETKGSEE